MLFLYEANVKPGHTSTKWNPTWIESRFLVSIVYFHNSPKPRSRVQARRNIFRISGDKPMQWEKFAPQIQYICQNYKWNEKLIKKLFSA